MTQRKKMMVPARNRPKASVSRRTWASLRQKRDASPDSAFTRMSRPSTSRFSTASASTMRSASMAARSLRAHAQAGTEAAPVLEQVVDAEDRQHQVHDQQPPVDDAVVRADLPARVFLHLPVARMALPVLIAHEQCPPRSAPGA